MGAPEAIHLVVNGRERTLDPPCTLQRLLEEMGLDRRFLVVERNGEPVAREERDALLLCDGDRLELVRPVAGG